MSFSTSKELAGAIRSELGENVYLCYQCKKCTSGCPVADEMDLGPNQVMRSLQLGRDQRALDSITPWICASCQTCVTRCPQNIDIPRIMDFLKITSQARGIKARIPAVPIFNQAGVRSMQLFGRMYELGVLGELKLRTMNFTEDVDLGLKLLARGKLKVFPSIARYARSRGPAPPPGVPANSVAYFPGCSLHSTGVEYDMSTRAVAKLLGLELREPKGWVCCGSSPGHAVSHEFATVQPMKNLALVAQGGHDEVTMPCAACFSRFKTAVYDVQREPGLGAKVAEEVGYSYDGQIKVSHLLDVFLSRIGLPTIRAAVKSPLTGMKVVCYYGCLLTRRPEVTEADHPEYPMRMDRLVEALGAEALDWSYKTDCCGGSLALTRAETAMRLSRKILQNARDVGAQAIVVGCSLCHINLDTRQEHMAKRWGLTYDLPIIYFTQLMGLAYGLDPKALGLLKHFVSPERLLAQVAASR
ncbi:MAG: heterodisulfide reductase-related iron-sulfur binding cluster [Chloroflexota bacterium]